MWIGGGRLHRERFGGEGEARELMTAIDARREGTVAGVRALVDLDVTDFADGKIRPMGFVPLSELADAAWAE